MKHTTITRSLLSALVVVTLLPPSLSAQAEATSRPPADTLTAHGRSVYTGTSKILIGSAELMPAEKYAFRPVDTVRTFGEIVAHVAQTQYAFCSAVRGEKNAVPKIDTTKATKGDLIAALTAAFAYCDKTYQQLNDVSATEMVKFMGGDKPKLGVLNINNIHTIEHYGNLVTYMRMNAIVPPTSDPTLMEQLQKK